jgi:glutathione S-transferase
MSLVLYGHLFSSYTQKVLIALYENGTPFEFRSIGPDTPQHAAEWMRRWPLRKFPLLVAGDRNVAETSIIIEYLQLAHPGPVRLLPAEPMAALNVRFLYKSWSSPTRGSKGSWLARRTARRLLPCSMPTGRTRFRTHIPRYVPTVPGCLHARPSRGRWRTLGNSGRIFRWEPRTGIDRLY